MKLVYFLPLLIVFVLTPAFAYNSGFSPVYQPPSISGGSNATELYCTFGEFLNSYNSTTNSFTCATGGSGGGENNTASNLGVGNGLYKQKVGVDLQFLSIFCAGDILCSTNSTDLRISYDTPTSSSGSGFDTIASSPQTTATILADNSTITNTATIKTLTQGTGITLTNGSNAVTVATSFKANTLTCSGTDKFSAYDNSTGLYTCSTDNSGGGSSGITTLANDVTCAVTATYCTVWTIPLTASSGNRLSVNMIGDSNTAGSAIQMRVQFDNSGNTGYCTYRTFTTATAEALDVLSATATTDTGETVWLAGANIPMPLNIDCGFETDATPGNALVQIQMEVASTGTIQKGSNYIKTP